MPTNVNDAIRRLSPARRKKVEKRAAELIAEEMTRQELRRARERTQVQVAKALGCTGITLERFNGNGARPLSATRRGLTRDERALLSLLRSWRARRARAAA